MENFAVLLEKYADFVVRVGVNVQPGQTLIINCPLEAAPLARLCVRSAYAARRQRTCRSTGATTPFPAPGWSWARRKP